jgi:hypothetical protein
MKEFAKIVSDLQLLIVKKITSQKCDFSATNFLNEIIGTFGFFDRNAIKLALSLNKNAEKKQIILNTLESVQINLELMCKMQYEADQINEAAKNMSTLLITEMLDVLDDPMLTTEWENYNNNNKEFIGMGGSTKHKKRSTKHKKRSTKKRSTKHKKRSTKKRSTKHKKRSTKKRSTQH